VTVAETNEPSGYTQIDCPSLQSDSPKTVLEDQTDWTFCNEANPNPPPNPQKPIAGASVTCNSITVNEENTSNGASEYLLSHNGIVISDVSVAPGANNEIIAAGTGTWSVFEKISGQTFGPWTTVACPGTTASITPHIVKPTQPPGGGASDGGQNLSTGTGTNSTILAIFGLAGIAAAFGLTRSVRRNAKSRI